MQFYDKNIQIALPKDVGALVKLLNNAYRGEASKKGWTTEAHLIGGEVRTDETSVLDVIGKEGSVMLKYSNDTGTIVGCVNLQKHLNKIYLGMFSVSPEQQGLGIGKKILNAAEEYAKENNTDAIYMTVISLRTELIEWYKRHGYVDTGKKQPFDEDGLTGNHLQPLEFIILEKKV